MARLIEELKRRRVFRVAGVYAVVAWGLIQVADTVLPALQMPDWTISFVTVLFILGFPIAIILSWAYQITPEGVQQDSGQQLPRIATPSSDRTLVYATFALVLAVLLLQIGDRFLGGTDSTVTQAGQATDFNNAPIIRSTLNLGVSARQPILNINHEFSLSPDGSKLAYTITDESGASLEIYDLAAGASTVLVEDGAPFSPRFSPSGNMVLFADIANAALNSRPTVGGRTRVITDLANLAVGANWIDDDTVVFTHNREEVLYTIPVNGGEPVSLNIPVQNGERQSHPRTRPGSDWLLYTVTGPDGFYEGRIDAFNLKTREVKNLIDRGYNATYAASGHIVFMRDGDLWVSVCDPVTAQTCEIEALAEAEVQHNRGLGIASYSMSDTGLILFHHWQNDSSDDTEDGGGSDLVWQDGDGEIVSHQIPVSSYNSRFSPGGDKVLFDLRGDNSSTDIAIYDTATQSIERRTFTNRARMGLWNADGSRIVYSVNNGGAAELWITNADGSGQPRLLVSSMLPVRASSISPDGTQLVYTEGRPDGRRIKLLALTAIESSNTNLLSEDIIHYEGAISPDGRWIAYVSRELGREEIFVRPFPNVQDGKWQITYNGGLDPQWTRDSRQLYFLDTSDSSVYRINVEGDNSLRTGESERISDSISWVITSERHFVVSPDGTQLIYRKSRGYSVIRDSSPTLVYGWHSRLRQLTLINQ